MEDNSWMNDPRLENFDQDKLKVLQQLASQGSEKSQNEMLSFLMMAMNQGKKKGLNFSPSEIQTILEVLKMGKSPQEQRRMDKLVQMLSMIRK